MKAISNFIYSLIEYPSNTTYLIVSLFTFVVFAIGIIYLLIELLNDLKTESYEKK